MTDKNIKNKTDLPLPDYFTLEQAAKELNVRFDRTDIDKSYLIQMAAAAKIRLVVPTVDDAILVFPSQDQAKNEALKMLVCRDTHHLFFVLEHFDAAVLASKKEVVVTNFWHFYIYNLLNNYSLSTIKGYSVFDHLIDKFYQDNPMQNNKGIFLEDKDVSFGVNDQFCFGVGDRSYVIDFEADPDFYDHIDERIRTVKITKNDLYILKPELELIFSNELRTLGNNDLIKETGKPNTLGKPRETREDSAADIEVLGAVLVAVSELSERINQTNLVTQIEGKKVRGMSKTTLNTRFADANRKYETRKNMNNN